MTTYKASTHFCILTDSVAGHPVCIGCGILCLLGNVL